MNQDFKNKRQQKNAKLRETIDVVLDDGDAFLKEHFSHLGICDYRYKINSIEEELMLEREVVYGLVEDYIIQVLKSNIIIGRYLKEPELDYVKIRAIVRKNLEVAKNLIIKDATIVLQAMMQEDDLEKLTLYMKALEVCALRLSPLCGYETINLRQLLVK